MSPFVSVCGAVAGGIGLVFGVMIYALLFVVRMSTWAYCRGWIYRYVNTVTGYGINRYGSFRQQKTLAVQGL